MTRRNGTHWNPMPQGSAGRCSKKSNNPGFLQKCFVDVPELGHYFEYIFPEQAGIDFFERVPGN